MASTPDTRGSEVAFPSPRPQTLSGGQLADVSTALVQLHRRFYGRGPTRAKTIAGDDVLTTVLAQILTTVEETLVERGQSELVVNVRTAFQHAMRHEFVAAVEAATGRTVLAFSSGVDVGRGIATETFVFEPFETEQPRDPSSERQRQPGGVRQTDPVTRHEVREQAREVRSEAEAVRAEARQAARRRHQQGPT